MRSLKNVKQRHASSVTITNTRFELKELFIEHKIN